MRLLRYFLLLLIGAAVLGVALAPARAGVLMQGFYRDVPSPAAGDPAADWWWDHLARQAQALKASGFTAIWIPPVMKGAAGGYSDGYDPFDDYDIGSKNQKGTIPTRYGTRQQLERLCAILRANGLDVYVDLVENHRDGDDGAYHFLYADAYGNPKGARFEKGPLDFHPNVPQDPYVPLGGSEDFNQFGRDLAPINDGYPNVSTWIADGLNQGGDWLTKALDLQGYRLDDVKGISTQWLYNFLNSDSMAGKFAVGEFFDGNLSAVENWVQDYSQMYPPGMQGRANAFDFPLREQLKQLCNNPGSFDMDQLDHAGLVGIDPLHAVTFVENHDTDGSDPIVADKAMGYAYILTSEGYPCVFYRDYSTDPGCYGMKPVIDNLVWIHEHLASGPTVQRWKNFNTFAYERLGGYGTPPLLTGLSSNGSSEHTITCQTSFGYRAHLHDYTGHEPDVWTDDYGNATITLPPDVNGAGYVCYSYDGLEGQGFPQPTYSTTQEYAGAADLDIPPAGSSLTPVCTVDAAGGTTLSGQLYFDTSGWGAGTGLTLEIDDPQGSVAATRTFSSGDEGGVLSTPVNRSGAYTFRIESYGTSSGGSTIPAPAYWLRASYIAPKTVDTSAPATKVVLPAPTGQNGWYTGPVQVTLQATDPDDAPPGSGSDVAATHYILDRSGNAILYGGPFSVAGDGSHTVNVWSVDFAGNFEKGHDAPINIDGTPPQTTASAAGDTNGSGIYRSAVTVTLSASDNLSGVASTTYSVDDGPAQIYTGAPFTVSGDGLHTVSYGSVDAAGNAEKTQTLSFRIDTTPPTTTAAVTGPAGNNGWYTGPVSVTLTGTDPDGAADVASTQFQINGGAVQGYTTPIALNGNGITTISFWSVDLAGNLETAKTVTVKEDSTPPMVTAAATPNMLWPPDGRTVTVVVSGKVTDLLSGVDLSSGSYAVVDSEGLVQPSGPVALNGDGAYSVTLSLPAARAGADLNGRTFTVTIRATDLAGNPVTATAVVTVPHDQEG